MNRPATPRPLNGAIWNVLRDRRPRKVRRALVRAVKKYDLDFVLLQEFKDYRKFLQEHPIPGYRLVTHNGPAKSQNPILIRNTVRITNVRYDYGGGDGWWTVHGKRHAPCFFTTGLLDGWLRVMNVHFVPSVDFKNGKAVGPKDRVDDYLESSASCVKFALEGRDDQLTLIGGDFNEGRKGRGKGSPFWIARKGDLDMYGPLVGPGHDRLDMVLTDARMKGFRKVGTFGSDHAMHVFRVFPN